MTPGELTVDCSSTENAGWKSQVANICTIKIRVGQL